MPQSFDFEQHKTRAFEAYGAIRPRYVRYATTIENILRMALREIATHQISARAKDLDRFAAKASKPDPEDPTKPKYPNPLGEIEDMAAARVITYVLRTLPSVEDVVHREFNVVQRSDKSDRLIANALVGYRSIHFIIEMKSERVALLEYEEFRGLRAEVQIRTILQHAWAEIEHDMRYKPAAEPNKILSQRFTALAGLIEVGDREFDQIYEIDERRRRELVDLAQINEAAPEPTAEPARPLPDVEQRIPSLRQPDEPTQPRDMIAAGKYSDAIIRYNLLIELEPRQFGHYLGRAKARFLSGDAAGALSDIQVAETLSPGHRSIARLRDLIVGRPIGTRPGLDASLAIRLGHTALRDGNASVALEKYSEAERLGFNPVFSVFNLAMARFIGREFDIAQRTLDRIEPYPRSALEFNVITLRTLCYLMAGGKKIEESLERIRAYLEKVRASIEYVYGPRSPIFDLEQGARKVFDGHELAKIEPVFAILHTASPGTAERPLDTAPTTTAAEFMAALVRDEAEGRDEGIMYAASNLGRIARESGNVQDAVAFFTRAADAARRLGRSREEQWNLGNLGSVHRDAGELTQAEDCYREALRIAEAIGDSRAMAITLENLGIVMARRGDLTAAELYMQRAAAIDQDPRFPLPMARRRANLGIVKWRAGKNEEARTEFGLAFSGLTGQELGGRFSSAVELETELSKPGSDELPFV